MKKVKIAQIGTSKHSHGLHTWRSLVKLTDFFDVAGYALPENEREKFPQLMDDFDGFKEMTVEEILNDPEIEAVVIETEEIYLFKYAKMAIDHGKHIHMEKPGGRELEDLEYIIDNVKKKGKVFHTGYMYRYNPVVSDLMEKIKRGELGEIYSVEAQMSCSEPLDCRQFLGNFKGGMMFFLGCHLVDLVYRIKGEPEKVIPFNHTIGYEGVTSEDYGMAVLDYKNGASFIKTSAHELGGFLRRQLVVAGTKGTVEIKPLEICANGLQTTRKKECYNNYWHEDNEVETSEEYDRYDTMMSSFAEYIRGDKQNPYTPDYELSLFKLILKCCGADADN